VNCATKRPKKRKRDPFLPSQAEESNSRRCNDQFLESRGGYFRKKKKERKERDLLIIETRRRRLSRLSLDMFLTQKEEKKSERGETLASS